MANVIVLFATPSEADTAVQQLLDSGVDTDQISLISRGEEREQEEDRERETDTGGEKSKALKGAGIGAAVGGVGGLLAGIAGLAIPGLGPLIAAGPIAAAIASAVAGAGLGAAAGGLIGALTEMGVPDKEAKHYQDEVESGKTLVAVNTPDDDSADRAVILLESCGAVDIGRFASREQAERPGAEAR